MKTEIWDGGRDQILVQDNGLKYLVTIKKKKTTLCSFISMLQKDGTLVSHEFYFIDLSQVPHTTKHSSSSSLN